VPRAGCRDARRRCVTRAALARRQALGLLSARADGAGAADGADDGGGGGESPRARGGVPWDNSMAAAAEEAAEAAGEQEEREYAEVRRGARGAGLTGELTGVLLQHAPRPGRVMPLVSSPPPRPTPARTRWVLFPVTPPRTGS
jgi:hypothetical protein